MMCNINIYSTLDNTSCESLVNFLLSIRHILRIKVFKNIEYSKTMLLETSNSAHHSLDYC